MSRNREEADAGHEIHIAVSRGVTLAGRVITSAGLILAGTFAALLLAPLPNLRQIGFGVTVGILIDTFLVRSLLVPASGVDHGPLGPRQHLHGFLYLPLMPLDHRRIRPHVHLAALGSALAHVHGTVFGAVRSEERREGKEG